MRPYGKNGLFKVWILICYFFGLSKDRKEVRPRGVDGKHERSKGTDNHSNANEDPEWDIANPVKENDNRRNNHRIHPDHDGRFSVNHVKRVEVYLDLIPKKSTEGFPRLFFGIVQRMLFFLFWGKY
jgi:hypothetical protein